MDELINRLIELDAQKESFLKKLFAAKFEELDYQREIAVQNISLRTWDVDVEAWEEYEAILNIRHQELLEVRQLISEIELNIDLIDFELDNF